MAIIHINLKIGSLRALLENNSKSQARKGLLEIGVDVFGMKEWDFDFVLAKWPSWRFDILDNGLFHTLDLKLFWVIISTEFHLK